MEPEFWHGRWQRNEIGFHEGQPNDLLVRFVNRLKLKPGARIFVPLCGKAADLFWLVDQGYRVTGVELSPIAVEQFFAENAITPEITHIAPFVRHQAPGIVIDQGDFFDLSAEILGEVDAVYDRAALVALPGEMRRNYARHLVAITKAAPQLSVSFEYDPASMSGPPHSVDRAQVHEMYENSHAISLLHRAPLADLKTARDAHECAWLLQRRA